MTACAQDVLFTANLLLELVGDKLLKPSYVCMDSMLFLAQNNSISQRTKHLDIRHRFIFDIEYIYIRERVRIYITCTYTL
jgi:hypothetical protein